MNKGTMMSKGSDRRKDSNDKTYRDNYPKMKDEFIPKWKRELKEKKEC